MNRLFAIMTVVCLLFGCSKHKTIIQSTVRADFISSAATNQPFVVIPPSESLQTRKIFGAFGFQLGQKLPPNYEIKRDHNGSLMSIVDTTNFPPFDSVCLYMLDDGRIYSLLAVGSAVGNDADAICSALTNKFGQAKGDIHQVESWTIDDGYASVILWHDLESHTISVSYRDHELLKDVLNEQASRNEANGNRMATNL